MINIYEVNETNNMIEHENLDVRTITLGISLLDCIDSDLSAVNEKIYRKITTAAKDLVSTGKAIEKDFGIPIVNKRISVTPIALIGGAAGALAGMYFFHHKTKKLLFRAVPVLFAAQAVLLIFF